MESSKWVSGDQSVCLFYQSRPINSFALLGEGKKGKDQTYLYEYKEMA